MVGKAGKAACTTPGPNSGQGSSVRPAQKVNMGTKQHSSPQIHYPRPPPQPSVRHRQRQRSLLHNAQQPEQQPRFEEAAAAAAQIATTHAQRTPSPNPSSPQPPQIHVESTGQPKERAGRRDIAGRGEMRPDSKAGSFPPNNDDNTHPPAHPHHPYYTHPSPAPIPTPSVYKESPDNLEAERWRPRYSWARESRRGAFKAANKPSAHTNNPSSPSLPSLHAPLPLPV